MMKVLAGRSKKLISAECLILSVSVVTKQCSVVLMQCNNSESKYIF